MVSFKVTFEGESLASEDDKLVVFNEVTAKESIPEDFMPKMFEYLESDFPYQILYQIKEISSDSGKPLNSDNFVSIIAEYSDGQKGGLLLEDQDGILSLRGSWKIQDSSTLLSDIYSKPNNFELVVVTIAENLAP